MFSFSGTQCISSDVNQDLGSKANDLRCRSKLQNNKAKLTAIMKFACTVNTWQTPVTPKVCPTSSSTIQIFSVWKSQSQGFFFSRCPRKRDSGLCAQPLTDWHIVLASAFCLGLSSQSTFIHQRYKLCSMVSESEKEKWPSKCFKYALVTRPILVF